MSTKTPQTIHEPSSAMHGSAEETRKRLRRKLRGLKASMEWAASMHMWMTVAKHEAQQKTIRAQLKAMRPSKKPNAPALPTASEKPRLEKQ